MTSLQVIVGERRFRLAGHVLRLPDHRHSKTAMRWTPARGTCRRGRPSSKENMETHIPRRPGTGSFDMEQIILA